MFIIIIIIIIMLLATSFNLKSPSSGQYLQKAIIRPIFTKGHHQANIYKRPSSGQYLQKAIIRPIFTKKGKLKMRVQ
jgi:hypothetical protein